MNEFKIALADIDKNGQTYQYDNQLIWKRPLQEFNIACTIVEDIKAELFILPEQDGCLFRGKISGKVEMPCSRCAEGTLVSINYSFDEFEEYPRLPHDIVEEDEEDLFEHDSQILILEHGGIQVDYGSLLWEELSLCLPVKLLCESSCKGVCLQCGKNLNTGICSCADAGTDPRMEALRNLKIQ